jgi:2,4-dienoyl-CoA reductase-like NADH-dependent reductase (Old Yellow Enzyme family)
LLLEVFGKTREAVGGNYPVLAKLNGSDNLREGFCLEEARLVALALDAAGVDAIEVSSGTPASGGRNLLRRGIDFPEREAYNIPLIQAIKLAVRCPVIVVGGIRSVCTAKDIIRHNEADYVDLCRPLVQEPGLPKRRRGAEGDTLARCSSCNGFFKAALKGNFRCVKTEARKTITKGKSACGSKPD